MQSPPLDPQLLDELARVYMRAALDALLAQDKAQASASDDEQEAAGRR